MGAKLTLTVSRMEGNSNAKCRLWRLRLFVDGKPAKSKRFHGTYGQAKAAGEDFKAEYAAQLALTGYDPDMTFEQYADRWLQRRRDSGDFENQTLRSNGVNVRGLCRVIGQVPMQQLSRARVMDCLAELKAGAASGREISGSTLRFYYTTLKAILSEAVYDEVIAKNPCDNVRPPKPDTAKKAAIPFDEYSAMLTALEDVRGDAHTVAILLIAMNGFRRSEVVGLDWDDDLGDGIAVRGSIEYMTGRKKGPKTSSGVRVIPMTERTRAVLDVWRPEQRRMLDRLGVEQTEKTPIVTSIYGKRMSSGTLANWWKLHGPREYGVSCTLHGLRHTFLTYLAADGNAFAIKNIAGWSKISMADVYVHDDEAANAKSMQTFERRIGGTETVQIRRNAAQRKETQSNAENGEAPGYSANLQRSATQGNAKQRQ